MNTDPKAYTVGPDAAARDVDLDEEVVLRPDGTRLTEADAEELAEQILRRRGRGRPSLSGDASHSPVVRTRVTVALRQRLADRAEREGKRPSQVVRDALESYLA